MIDPQVREWIRDGVVVAACLMVLGGVPFLLFRLGRVLDFFEAHSALSDSNARELVQELKEDHGKLYDRLALLYQSKGQRDAVAQAISESSHHEIVIPDPPPLPPPTEPPPKKPEKWPPGMGDSKRASLALAVTFLAAGSWAGVPSETRMDGMDLLRAGNYQAAEQHFRHDGNVLRVAECCILRGEFGQADGLCENVDSPASVRLRAISALERGDRAAGMALFQLAAERGDDVSMCVIEAEGTNYAL